MTKDALLLAVEEYKKAKLSQGMPLEDICDDIEMSIGDRIDEWMENAP